MLNSWVLPILLSAICLGVYEVALKNSVNRNDTFAVLFLATLSGSGFFAIATLLSGDPSRLLCPLRDYLLISAKSVIVSASWVCVYSSMRDMPISLVAPIRATSPLWTFLGGVLLFGEMPNLWQAVGMVVIFTGYFLFSVWGKREGFSWNCREMLLIAGGTLLGACSSVYDKFLLGRLGLDRMLVQFYFAVDLVVILGILAVCTRKVASDFQWRWTIPVTGILLIAADWFYFGAVAQAGTQIGILSLLRRCNVIVSFGLGCFLFHDLRQLKEKIIGLGLILGGALILALA